NTDKLKGKLKEKVENNKEQAFQSKQLATIIVDVPVEFEEDKLIMEEPDKAALKELFTELEFRRLAEQVLGETIATPVKEEKKSEEKKSESAQIDLFGDPEHPFDEEKAEAQQEAPAVFKNITEVKHNYISADTKEKREKLVTDLSKQKSVCFDTETTGLDTLNVEIVGMSFSWKAHEGYYVPLPADQEEAQQIVDAFKPFFENETIEKIGQNIKYDLSVLKNYGVEIKGHLFDTMIAHFLIQPEMRHGMDVLSETYLGYSPVSIETLIGKKGKTQLNMRDADPEKIKEYAAEDADVTFQLKQKFEPMLEKVQAKKLFGEVEIPLVPVLAAMEREGIKLDIKALKEYSIELEKEIVKVDKEIQTLAGTPFNTSSPKQVGEVLFEVLKIVEKAKKTKTGQYATGEDVLSKLANKHPIVPKILDYRELVKLKNTYVDTLPE
ncbi:MAG: DNA polymerase, partial [Bacteroidota bacterium]